MQNGCPLRECSTGVQHCSAPTAVHVLIAVRTESRKGQTWGQDRPLARRWPLCGILPKKNWIRILTFSLSQGWRTRSAICTVGRKHDTVKNQCELFRFFIQRAAAHWRSQLTSTEAQHSERLYRLCSGEREVVPKMKVMLRSFFLTRERILHSCSRS